jgi:hypothetical protein
MNDWNISEKSLEERIAELEKLVQFLIDENVGTTNVLYELENKLDMLSACQYNMLDSSSQSTDV